VNQHISLDTGRPDRKLSYLKHVYQLFFFLSKKSHTNKKAQLI